MTIKNIDKIGKNYFILTDKKYKQKAYKMEKDPRKICSLIRGGGGGCYWWGQSPPLESLLSPRIKLPPEFLLLENIASNQRNLC